jgi:uncharacterized protein (DUF427 family)
VAEKMVLKPSAKHPITIEPYEGTVTVTMAGKQIAKTDDALLLSEGGYDPVRYIPVDDVDFSQLEATDNSSYCPYKGTANYYSITVGGEDGVNAVWQYREPHEAVAEIEGHVAFYADKVQFES